MELKLTSRVKNGRTGVEVEGNASSADLMTAICALIHGHLMASQNIGVPRHEAVSQIVEVVAAALSGAGGVTDGEVVTLLNGMRRGNNGHGINNEN